MGLDERDGNASLEDTNVYPKSTGIPPGRGTYSHDLLLILKLEKGKRKEGNDRHDGRKESISSRDIKTVP
jgi:hypothetical protein